MFSFLFSLSFKQFLFFGQDHVPEFYFKIYFLFSHKTHRLCEDFSWLKYIPFPAILIIAILKKKKQQFCLLALTSFVVFQTSSILPPSPKGLMFSLRINTMYLTLL